MSFDKLRPFKMKIKNPSGEIRLLFLSILIIPIFILGSKYARISESIPSRNIEAGNSSDIFLPPSNILDWLAEKDDELMSIPVSMGSKEIVYYENRYTILDYKTQNECFRRKGVWDEERGVCKAVTQKRSSDKEIIFGLKLLNTATKNIETIAAQTKITTDGVSIVAPDGYQIEIVERPNGIKWNLWNTLYRVVSPENTVVIKNNYPREVSETVSRVVNGKVINRNEKIVRGFPYVPHSEFFEQEENRKILVEDGGGYLKNE